MLLVVLGAGASVGAVSCESDPEGFDPPLTRNLFAPVEAYNKVLRERFPAALPIVQHLRDKIAAGSSLEGELAQIQAEADDADKRGLLAVRFYLQWLLARCSNHVANEGISRYHTLVRDLARWSGRTGESVTYATFNYDTLLEQALMARYDCVFRSLDDYWTDEVRLVKLHGSVNWAHPTGAMVPAQDHEDVRRLAIHMAPHLKAAAGDFRVTHEQEPATNPVMGPDGATVEILVPAIAIPVSGSKQFECPQAHLKQLSSVLPSVTRILSVGWAGAEVHFRDLLASCLPGSVDTLLVTGKLESAVALYHLLSGHQADRAVQRAWGQHLNSSVELHGFQELMTYSNLRRFLEGWQ